MAIDATPLLGHPTGVGAFCAGAIGALAGRPEVDLRPYAVTWRGRSGLAGVTGIGTSRQRPIPARPVHASWRRLSVPPLEWFIGEVDVVHGTNFVAPPTRHRPTVVTVHDLTPLHHPEMCNKATLAYPDLIRRAIDRGAWVHAVSQFVADEVVQAFEVAPDRVRVVRHGVPPLPAVDDAVADEVLQRLLPVGTSSYVLAIGTAEPRKDLPGLVEAFDVVARTRPDLALVLVGPPGWGEEGLQGAINRAAAASRVVRTGWLDDSRLASVLARATLLAYPSWYEGFGFPPLQAMVAGVPVVTTRAGALPEVLGEAACFVEPGDHAALAGAIEQVLDDGALRTTLTTAGRARAALYQWADSGRGLAQLYRDAASAGA